MTFGHDSSNLIRDYWYVRVNTVMTYVVLRRVCLCICKTAKFLSRWTLFYCFVCNFFFFAFLLLFLRRLSRNFGKRLLASSCLSVHMEQLGSHCPVLRVILLLEFFFRKSFEKIQVSLKSDKNDGYFT